MKLENQVCSLELAKKLKELGVDEDNILWWGGISRMGIWCDHVKEEINDSRFKWIKTYTVAELGDMLPDRIDKKDKNGGKDELQIWRCRGYCIEYHTTFESPNVRIMAEHDTEANVRAKMLIYLLNNNQN